MEAFEVLISDRNNAQASAPAQECRPSSFESHVSINHIRFLAIERKLPRPDLFNCIGAYMRVIS